MRLNDISTEISRFKSNDNCNEFGIELNNLVYQKVLNYQPLSKNRKTRSRLYCVKKSKIITNNNLFNENNNQLSSLENKKIVVKSNLRRKNLI